MSTINSLLSKIDSFLSASGLSEAEFSRLVTGNPTGTYLVTHMRKGNDIRTRTADKIEAVIEEYDRRKAAMERENAERRRQLVEETSRAVHSHKETPHDVEA